MKRARAAAIATVVVVIGMLVWLTVAQWELANRVATVASAVGTVAAVGIAVWAVWRTTSSSGGTTSTATGETAVDIRAHRTGSAQTGLGGVANTGVRITNQIPPVGLSGDVTVERSGSASAGGDGEANTGVDIGDTR